MRAATAFKAVSIWPLLCRLPPRRLVPALRAGIQVVVELFGPTALCILTQPLQCSYGSGGASSGGAVLLQFPDVPCFSRTQQAALQAVGCLGVLLVALLGFAWALGACSMAGDQAHPQNRCGMVPA